MQEATGVEETRFSIRKSMDPDKETKIVELVIFVLEKEEFGADIGQVREVIRPSIITPIPDSPPFIKGITNVRGEIIIVIDLKKRFSLPQEEETEGKHIVITRQEKNVFGLVVDEVTEVLRIPQTDIKVTPHLVSKIDKEYISGVLTMQNRLVMILDLEKVLLEDELDKLAKLTTGLQERGQMADDREQKKDELATPKTVGKKRKN